MAATPEPPTEAEWRVLRIVWEHGPCAARDVVKRAGADQGWSTSTVKTLLRRLVEKGHLEAERTGNSFRYRTRRSPLPFLRGAADSLLENAVEGTVVPLLAYMVRRSKLSDGEMQELRDLLERTRTESAKETEDGESLR